LDVLNKLQQSKINQNKQQHWIKIVNLSFKIFATPKIVIGNNIIGKFVIKKSFKNIAEEIKFRLP